MNFSIVFLHSVFSQLVCSNGCIFTTFKWFHSARYLHSLRLCINMAGRGAIILFAFLVLIGLSQALSLQCSPQSVQYSSEEAVSITLHTDTNVSGKYFVAVDGNLIQSGELSFSAGDFGYSATISFVPTVLDRNYVVTVVDGNESASCSVLVYDVPKITVSPPFPEAWTRDSNYVVSCSDSSSCTVTVRVDDGNTLGPAPSIRLRLPDGEHTVSVIARDALGNESSFEGSVRVDSTPPEISGFYLTGADCPYYHFALEASDDGSGINYDGTKVLIDGEPCGDGCSVGDGVSISDLSKGVHTVSVSLCDYAGNCTTARDVVSVVDPETCVAVEGPFVSGRTGSNGWYVGDVSVRIHPISDVVVLLDGNIIDDYDSFSIHSDGNHVLTLKHESEDTGVSELNVYVPVDQTPPVVACDYNLTPYVVLLARASDPVSGVDSLEVCRGSSCANGELNTGFVGVGSFAYSVIAKDRAGNVSERNCVTSISLDDYIGEINAERIYLHDPVRLTWSPGSHYDGNYVVTVDKKALGEHATSVDLNLAPGHHRFCISVPDSNVSRCVDLNVDLYPPRVALVVPSRARAFHVPVSWKSSDDYGVKSAWLFVDGKRESVATSGHTVLHLPPGLHGICVAVTDFAGRTTRACKTVRVHGGWTPVSYTSVTVVHHRFVPRDSFDRQFMAILREHVHFSTEDVRLISSHRLVGTQTDANSFARRASAEFNAAFVPLSSDAVVRTYRVGTSLYTFVARRVHVDSNVVYEYFPLFAPIFSDDLVSVRRGSMLAAFSPHAREYTYVVEGNLVGVPLLAVHMVSQNKSRPVHEQRSLAVVHRASQEHGSNVSVHHVSAMPRSSKKSSAPTTGYALLRTDYSRVLATALFVVAVFLILFDLSFR